MIAPCNCVPTLNDAAKFQDKTYDKKRVFTEPGRGGKDGHKCRCTACGATRDYSEMKKFS